MRFPGTSSSAPLSVQRNTRRALLRRFPYGIYCRIYPDTIVIVACMHGRRDPKRWRARR